jgi:zinc protease
MEFLNIRYEKYKLENGLDVILYHDDNLPLVSVNLWYKVGSSNETKGKTGIAHLFEHMMFQGSENVPKEMHFRLIQEAGGILNGSTNFDRTNYYEKAPSNYLELILWLESDRMGFLLPSLTQEKLNNQIDVVKNERLERYENQPYGLAWEIIISKLYPEGHPYSWPTIGFMEDITSYSLEDIHNFHKTYYSPSNASLVVAGDFDADNAKKLITKYFGDIPGNTKPNELELKEKRFENEIKLKRNENVQLDRIYLSWPSSKAYYEHDAALDILSDILTGSKNSRLHKNLVYDNELAQDVSAYQYSGKYGGHFMIVATAKPGISLDHLKLEIFKELNNIRNNGVTSKELEKSKNGIKSSFIYSLQNIDSIANQLNYYSFYLNEPNSFSYDLLRYDRTENSAIKEAVENYLLMPYIELQISPNK